MASDATRLTSAPGRPAPVFYPVSDGKPMAETQIHQEAMIELIQGLQDWYAADPLVYVAGNMFLYFVEGNPKRNVSPDVMVVQGVAKTVRDCYMTWQEGGKAPDLVIEVSSKSTHREDLGSKFTLYRDELRVREYILFDPLDDYLEPRLQGFRLDGDEYVAIPRTADRLPSAVLNLHFVAVGKVLRLFDPTTNQMIPNRLEALAESQNQRRRQANASATTIREQTATLADREMTIRAQAAALADREMTIREHAAALADREMTIREREMTIREQALVIGQKDLVIGRGKLEHDELRAEIARLKDK